MQSRRKRGTWIVACLLCLGFWQFGQGAYIPAKAWLAQELLLRAWDRATDGEDRAAPWPWADTWPVARLTSRAHGIDLVVLAGGSGRTLAFGPGHLSASAMPGNDGNAVIAGHRDTHFRFLRELRPGETLGIERPDGVSRLYRVMAADVVDSRHASIVLDTDTPVLTLITCYPFDAIEAGGTMRYVVTAVRVN